MREAAHSTQNEKSLGGVFFVMDKVPGRTLWPWYWAIVGISIAYTVYDLQICLVLYDGKQQTHPIDIFMYDRYARHIQILRLCMDGSRQPRGC